MDEKRKPWERQDGEPGRWFQRFERFRLMGPGRSLESVYRAECEANKRAIKRPSVVWYKHAREWQWLERAAAYDQHRIEQAEAEIDAFWNKKIMRSTEVLGRLSEMGRASPHEFIVIDEHGRSIRLNEEALRERGYLVKKISTSEGRTNSVSVEVYDAQSALQIMGRHHRLFSGEDDGAAGGSQTFELPASCLAPKFLDAYDDIQAHAHTEYVFSGGRGSTKSSFISLAIIYLIKNNPDMHGIALRQVANTLRDSVYSQIAWAISELGLDDEFKCTTSPLEITYLPTGQKIYFRGADEPGKIKSIKPPFGYIGIAWFEELDQFHGPEAIRNIEQSAIRGGDLAYIFKSFNPPKTAANWANKYIQIPKANQFQHHSTYLELGSRIRWLGKPWVEEAEHLKVVNPRAYEHEYLGIANGTGGLVFDNVQLRRITDEEIAQFDHVLMGNDWGYFPDPYAWAKCHYDAARLTLYIFDELRVLKASNRDTYQALVEKKGVTPDDLLISDSAEPKSVADYREYGLNCRGAEKGPESVKYSMKWLQSLVSIVIDPERCPETAEEFLNYELEQDKDGNFISEYPDKNNHSIDAVRYATNLIWRRRGQ